MKTVLILIALIVIVGVGLGFALDWFNLSSRKDESQPNVTLTVDKDKIEADKDKIVNRVQELGHQASDKFKATTQKAQD